MGIPPAFRWGSHPRASSIDALIRLLSQLKESGLPGSTPVGKVEVFVEQSGSRRERVRKVRVREIDDTGRGSAAR